MQVPAWILWCWFDTEPLALLSFTIVFFFISLFVSKIPLPAKVMPSAVHTGSFLSLRPDQDCGRSNQDRLQQEQQTSSTFPTGSAGGTIGAANGVNGHGHGHGDVPSLTNGVAKRLTNGSSEAHATNGTSPKSEDEFLRLASPQQDILLLHGPRQKYSLERARDIPELRGDSEILVQVLAIGLNPVDWKGADYGFSQPSYPWVNGRDFAGIVVKAPREAGRIQQGDVVFGPSTDYRDVRKAAYQEYVVTTDYNVARIPSTTTVKEGAASGVAFVAAATSLGVSFGLDFTSSGGPDFLRIVRQLNPQIVPEDIRDECFNSLSVFERPKAGEWLAIWGANTTTGQLALQLAKIAGLKVACIADLAKGGQRLAELGADFMVDKHDKKRAIEIIRAISGDKLRFGIDCTGKETAEHLEQALHQSHTGPKSHLLGLTGLPKQPLPGVVHHKMPIKLFHEVQAYGETVMQWLEELLVSKSLKLPDVDIAEGGLAGVNDALDRLRSGTVSGKRIVVPVGNGSGRGSAFSSPASPTPASYGADGLIHSGDDLSYHDKVNADPGRIKFAYWVPNVSGGLVISKIPQRTGWDLKSNVRYAKTAEKYGFEYALSQIRFMAGYGAENQHEPVSFSQALLGATEKLKVIAALLPGPWNPAVAAKQIASIDNYCDGRIAVNVVSGWFKAEVSYVVYRTSNFAS